MHDCEILWLPYLCHLLSKGRSYAFEIACEENLELEKHPEKKFFFSILYFYAAFYEWSALLKVSESSNGVMLISVVLLES